MNIVLMRELPQSISLPAGYTQLAYLESPGTADASADAYFSLPINATPGVDDLRIETQHFIPEEPVLFQAEGAGVNYRCLTALGFSGASGEAQVYVSLDGILNHPEKPGQTVADLAFTYPASVGVWQTYETRRGLSVVTLKENGIIKVSFVPEWGSNLPVNGVMGVFGRQAGANYTFYSLFGRKKTYKLWVNDELKYDLVPCVNPAGDVCFYNAVRNESVQNAGSEAFIAGVDTEPQLVELLDNLPNLRGQEGNSLQLRLADYMKTEKLGNEVKSKGLEKNWFISHI